MNNNYDALIDGIQKRNLTDEEYKQLETLVHFVRNIRYEAVFGVPFISGQMGDVNPSDKLAEWISICPAYGCDFSVLYKRVDDEADRGAGRGRRQTQNITMRYQVS